MKIDVVGAGLAGSITTRVLRSRGHDVTVYDDEDEFSASRASSNLYLASWLTRHKEGQRGIEVLESLGLEVGHPFESGIAKAMKVRHIPQSSLLVDFEIKKIERINKRRTTVLCCGYRSAELVPELVMTIKVGHSFFIKGTLKRGRSSITMVAPYRHQKLYQFSEGIIYYSDGLAVKPETFEKRRDELTKKATERMRALVPRGKVVEYRVGYRPIMPTHSFGCCLQVADKTWVINGGGKAGMAAYAFQADRLADQL